jgi:hypothetical protein
MSQEVMIDDKSAVSQPGEYLSEWRPPMEAVDQFQIETAGIRATDGRTRVRVFKCDIKAGTHSIHDAVFGFLRNAEFYGNSWFNKSLWEGGGCESRAAFQPLCARPLDNISQRGLGVGGPILRNKLFFCGAFGRISR